MRREEIAEVYSNDKDFDRIAGIRRVVEYVQGPRVHKIVAFAAGAFHSHAVGRG
jgi:hypothetical protein